MEMLAFIEIPLIFVKFTMIFTQNTINTINVNYANPVKKNYYVKSLE